MDYDNLANKVLSGDIPSREEAYAIIEAPSSDLMPILNSSFKIRKKYFDKYVQIHYLINAKSGICPEDCAYCSQSSVSDSEIEKYGLVDDDTLLKGAQEAFEAGSRRYCIVISARGPNDYEIERLSSAVKKIKKKFDLSICCSLGLLNEEQASILKESGVDRLNHNLNTSKTFYEKICTTHTYEDRVETLKNARENGLELCSGVIFGQGESNKDIVDICEELNKISPESIPVNFLNPIPGTPLEKLRLMTPIKCLYLLALMRFFNPTSEIRIAGGREIQLKSLQPLSLLPANSIFVDGYLTTPGQASKDAHDMIKDMGFVPDVKGSSDSVQKEARITI
tara:strand:+ start:708 stop:1721 length:1014 start_codon:yes stop_codon:yes gene_type:complete